MNYLRIKNWDSFQHYKDRDPPWIKLHRSLLDDYEFCALPDSTKAHLLLIWLHASHNSGRVPEDPCFLAGKIGAKVEIDLNLLIQAGFLIREQVASNALAERKQEDSGVIALARSREAEAEVEAEEEGGRPPADPPPDCPHEQIIDAYHELLPSCIPVRVWNDQRKGFLRQRWREDKKRQSVDWWRKFFGYVAESEFLTGRAETKPGRDPFVADLEWLIRPQNFAKVIEGKYHREAA